MAEQLSREVEYRPLGWIDGYLVGTDGSLWSKRTHRGVFSANWKLLGGTKKNGGYVAVVLSDGPAKYQRLVHRLVLETFVGPCPEGMEGCHNDGNPSNNRLENLRWDTAKSNHADKVKHGTQSRGERHHTAKMSEADLKAATDLYDTGEWTVKQVAEKVGVTYWALRNAISGRTWKHIPATGKNPKQSP